MMNLERIACANFPFAHAIISNVVSCAIFDELLETWPSQYLVPIQQSTPSGRRHLWLHNLKNKRILAPPWQLLCDYIQSPELVNALIMLKSLFNPLFNKPVYCWCRICEEDLPFILPTHIDHSNKELSIVWLFTQDRLKTLGTTLFGTEGVWHTPQISVNDAIVIPNTSNSLHGGDWTAKEQIVRRSVHIFLVRKEC